MATEDGTRTVVVLLSQFEGDGWASFAELQAYIGSTIKCVVRGQDLELTIGQFDLSDCREAGWMDLVDEENDCFRLTLSGSQQIEFHMEQLVGSSSSAT